MVDLTLGQVVDWWRTALGVRVVQYAILLGVVACVLVVGVASLLPESALQSLALLLLVVFGGAAAIAGIVGYRAYKRL